VSGAATRSGRIQKEGAMYATLRTYEMASDWDDELVKHLNDGFVGQVAQLPGFVAYYSLEAGARVFASVTIFDGRDGVEASNRLAAEYVQRRLLDRFPTPPEITAGEVRAHRVA
jgi:hypothetical protein